MKTLVPPGPMQLHVVAGLRQRIVRDRPEIVGQTIGTGEHAEHALHFFRTRGIDADDARMRIGRAHDRRVGLPVEQEIVAELAAPGDQPLVLRPSDRLSDEAVVGLVHCCFFRWDADIRGRACHVAPPSAAVTPPSAALSGSFGPFPECALPQRAGDALTPVDGSGINRTNQEQEWSHGFSRTPRRASPSPAGARNPRQRQGFFPCRGGIAAARPAGRRCRPRRRPGLRRAA